MKRHSSQAFILFGGVLATVSGALVWAKADSAESLGGVPALIITDSAFLRRGFDLKLGWLSIGWAIAICGIAAIALTLWGGAGEPPGWIPKAQFGLGGAVLLISLIHLAPQPGVAAAAAGGAAIAAGAVMAARKAGPV